MIKLILAGCLIFGASALAEPNISVNVNGTKYICSETECAYSCEGRIGRPIECNGVMSQRTIKLDQSFWLKRPTVRFLSCLAAIQETTDFEALAKCTQMRRQICD